MEFSELEHLTHLIGTSILVFLYLLRLAVLFRRQVAKDGATPKGNIGQSVLISLMTLVMPWRMESTRRHWMHYGEFVVFHLGVFANILASFAVTYIAALLAPPVNLVFAAVILAGLVAGTVRFVRRFALPEMRIISSFDDYISMFLVLLFLATGLLVMLGAHWAMVPYFVIAAFFLVYEPFSKIRHYIYYPFVRYFYGAQFGRRGSMGQEGKA